MERPLFTDQEPRTGGATGRTVATAVPAVVKTVAIVRHLNAGPSTGLSLTEIARDLGITKSHCHNLLKTLVAEGWAVFDAGRRRYALAPGLLADISRLISRGGRPLLIHEELVRLSLAARAPCVLTRIGVDNSFVAVDKAEEAAELLVSVPIGHRFAADAPAQMKARLAALDDARVALELDAWTPVAHTPTSIIDREEMEREIARTRRRGYAISRSEFTPGVMSIAASICDRAGIPSHILQCPGVQADIEVREDEIGNLIVAASRRIVELLGGRT